MKLLSIILLQILLSCTSSNKNYTKEITDNAIFYKNGKLIGKNYSLYYVGNNEGSTFWIKNKNNSIGFHNSKRKILTKSQIVSYITLNRIILSDRQFIKFEGTGSCVYKIDKFYKCNIVTRSNSYTFKYYHAAL